MKEARTVYVDKAGKPDRVLYRWQQLVRDWPLPTTAKAIAWAISTYMDADGTGAFPSLATIGRVTTCARNTVMDHLNLLEATGLLIRIRPKVLKPGLSTHYIAAVPPEPLGAVIEPKRNKRAYGDKEGIGATVEPRRNGRHLLGATTEPLPAQDVPRVKHVLRDEVEAAVESSTPDPTFCAACGDSAMFRGGEVATDSDGRPWCGWCEAVTADAS